MPLFGFGVWKLSGEETAQAVSWALADGYRLIDTASYYKNETAVGQAIKESGLPRTDVFITSKVWNDSHGFDKTLRTFEGSLKRLALDYLDLYLIHWPVEGPEMTAETWRALEKIYKDGLAKSIGVSNFSIRHLEDLLERAEIKPMVNQVELHPLMTRADLRQWCAERDIAVEAYAPLARGRCLDAPPIVTAAAKYGKTPAQVILRWQLQNGIAIIPKTARRERIKENAGLYDFSLTAEEVADISSLNRDLSVLSTVFPANDLAYIIS